VTITGSNLLNSNGTAPTVTFTGVAASGVSGTATSIKATVASGTPMGNGSVAVTTDGGTASAAFRVSKK
jgi:hypothetical protein